ncbi:MAG: ATP-binding cassette domain-containing protein [Candidatus Omnitrophica bacterium]|nr:ATP-binding cassette domain-containing protein [Candidatus Omnitrophota bacterium]
MIEVKNLSKYYGNVKAVDGVSFEVKKGEILGFLGPNAAGKTTTMRILVCYLPATSGEAKVDGYDVFLNPLEVRRRIGYLPENVPLYNDMRVTEYLDFRAKIKGVGTKDRQKRLKDIIEKCALGDVRKRIIGQLSKGYKQRVGLAEALVHNPDILILDEPTVGLDPNQIRQARNLIKELGREHTIILSTHILPEVEMICGRVIIIDKGKIIASDTPRNLTERLHGYGMIKLQVKGESVKIRQALEKTAGIEKVNAGAGTGQNGEISNFLLEIKKGIDARENIFRAIIQGGGIILEMSPQVASLEDIFVHLTTREKEV